MKLLVNDNRLNMSTEKSPYPAGGATAPPASGGYQGYPPPQQQAYSGQQQYTGQQQYPSQQPEPQEAPPSYQTATALPPLRTTNAYYAENFNDKSIRRGEYFCIVSSPMYIVHCVQVTYSCNILYGVK